MGEFVRDPNDWLRKLSPGEWIRAALGEIERATAAYHRGDMRGGSTGAKRAAGMALNGALIVEPNASWGRTYVEHVAALAADPSVPEAVRSACIAVLDTPARAVGIVSLRTPRANERVLEAARDVVAHAWAVVKKHE